MSTDKWILGISCSHNGAVALVKNGKVVVAIQEERLTRQKRQQIYGSQPILSVQYCLDYAGIKASDLSMIVMCSPRRADNPVDDLGLNPVLRVCKNTVPVEMVPHHLGHCIGAFTTSGFDEAAVLVVDGVGSPYDDLSEAEKESVVERVEDGWETASMYQIDKCSIMPLEKHLIEKGIWLSPEVDRMKKFGSLGGMFSSAAFQIFGDPLEAGKVMGLAPYGEPTIPVEEFFVIEDGKFRFTNKVIERFVTKDKWPKRQREYQNLAASVQEALEKALSYLVSRLLKLSPVRNFCYTGGVALNSVANEKLIREFDISKVFIQPEAEDSGTAIGAAIYGYWKMSGKFPNSEQLKADSRGRIYTKQEVQKAIQGTPGVEIYQCDDVVAETVELLCQGKVIGLFSGESELGPRALGHRSILCDPRIPDAKEILNLKVKHREAFRPFAPVILLEKVHEWFDTYNEEFECPFMLRVCKFREDKMNLLPAVTHVDGTGRLQTITKESNGFYYSIVEKFYEKTDVPVLVNTSFNIMGEPIVETPEDALWCLIGTDIDYVTFENCIVKKKDSYNSILDLVPYISARRYNVHNLIEDGKMNFSLDGKYSFASFVIPTYWGEMRQIISTLLLPMLELVDGKRDGWQILGKLPEIQKEEAKSFDLAECIQLWEGVSFGRNEQMQGYTSNSSILIDNITYARMVANILWKDSGLPKDATSLKKTLLRLKRSGVISFREKLQISEKKGAS